MADGLDPLLAYAAGTLTILSPCVLPLVPIVIGSAARSHRWGPVALCIGLVVSFTAVGFAVAALGASSGFDGEIVRIVGAAMLLLVGLVLVLPAGQALLTRAATPLAAWANRRQSGLERFGVAGQAGIGVLLGMIWSPCVGPTLGAATVLAAQGKDLVEVGIVMGAFGLGIASVLLLLAFATRGFVIRWRSRLMATGSHGRRILGGLLIMVAMLIMTGGDRLLEGLVVALSPDWLNDLTTAI